MQRKITKRAVDAAAPTDKPLLLWDTETKGFGLKVTPGGRKVYVLQYRMPGTSTRRITIGAHGNPWTPDGARARAVELLGDIARGDDPADAKRRAKAELSISELCDLYLAEGVRTKKPSTVEGDRARIDRHILPVLGRMRLRALSRSDINGFMSDVAGGKTATDEKTGFRGRAIVRGGKSAANRSLATLSAVLSFAVERGLSDDNPVRGVKKYKEGKRTRFLSNSEIAHLGETLRRAEANGANPYSIAAIRLLILTGCRKNEILGLRWDEVDFDAGFLRLADSKTGAKEVYLGAPALALLSALPKQESNPFVICGHNNGQHLVGLQKAWAGLRDDAGLKDVRLHDLRHSFASVAAKSGESLFIIGKVLGHAGVETTARYAHLRSDPVKQAAEGISNEIWRSLNAK